MIEIYTDAAVDRKKNSVVACCIVLRDSTYMGKNSFTDCPRASTTFGELYGAIEGIKYASGICEDFESEQVTLYTDSKDVLRAVHHVHWNDAACKALDLELQNLIDKYNISVKLIRGHQIKANPNKVVDSLASSVLYRKST